MGILISVSCEGSAIADHFRALAAELRQRGHSVTMATWGKDAENHWAPDGVELVRYPSPRPTKWVDIRFSCRLMKERGVDCVIANFGAENANALAAWWSRVPVRVLWHHTLLRQILLDRGGVDLTFVLQLLRKRLVYGLATAVVGNAAATARELRSVWRLPESKVAMFWYGMPDPAAGMPDEPYRLASRVLCPGRLHPSKGQDVLIRALPAVLCEAPDVEVVFAGGGTEKEKLERLAGELGVANAVRFAGALPRTGLLRAMAEAAVVVVPSRDEAFGLVNIEAMAMGTPVVASRVGGIPEIVRDGVDGLLFEPGNAEELAECLVRLLRNEDLRAEMGRNARQRFLEEFESSRVVKRQADWLEGLVRKARRRVQMAHGGEFVGRRPVK